jgi:hypothetical protein
MITPAPTTQSNNPLAVPTSAFAIAPDITISILNQIARRMLTIISPYRPDSLPLTLFGEKKSTAVTCLDSGETVSLTQLETNRPFAVHATQHMWPTELLCEVITTHLCGKK